MSARNVMRCGAVVLCMLGVGLLTATGWTLAGALLLVAVAGASSIMRNATRAAV